MSLSFWSDVNTSLSMCKRCANSSTELAHGDDKLSSDSAVTVVGSTVATRSPRGRTICLEVGFVNNRGTFSLAGSNTARLNKLGIYCISYAKVRKETLSCLLAKANDVVVVP